MRSYSVQANLRYMAMIVTSPQRLIASFSGEPSVWYGGAPFLAYSLASTCGCLAAYAAGYQQAISPLPKLLPIPDDQYLLYQAILGPFIKAAGVFIFAASLWVMAKWLRFRHLSILPVVIFYLFIGNSVGLLAFVVDQVAIWTAVQGSLRFALSTIHPIALLVDIVYVVACVRVCADASLGRAIALVVPGMTLARPVLGVLFR